MTDVQPSQSCCQSHKSWPELTQHLIEAFPDVSLQEIVGIIGRTRQAESDFGLPDDERLATAEVIVRNQLLQLSGEQPALGHSDLLPQRHGEPDARPA
jgi:hypothetical protein